MKNYNSLPPLLTLLALLSAQVFIAFAEPLKVVIISPVPLDFYTGEVEDPASYDTTLIQTHLEGMLQGASGGNGSSVTLLTDSESLMDVYNATTFEVFEGDDSSWYFTDGYEDKQHLENNDYDVAVLVNRNEGLKDTAIGGCYEGTALLSKRLLARGTDVYLLEPELTSASNLSTKEKVHRIANGCGIHVIPAGEALRQVSSADIDTDTSKAYLMAATIFTSLTNLGSEDGSSYSPFAPNVERQFEQAVDIAITDAQTTTHYTGSYNGLGMVRHRPVDLSAFNNTIHYAWNGTSTESGINASLTQLIDHYYRKDGTTPITSANAKIDTAQGLWSGTDESEILNDIANKDNFLFVYSRNAYDDLSTALSNQSNMVPMTYGRQSYSGNSGYQNGAVATTYAASIRIQNNYFWKEYQFDTHGAILNPSYQMYGRAYEQFTDVPHLYDNHHQNQEGCDMVAAGMLATSVGIDFDADDMNRFHHYREGDPYYIGWNTTMQLAYLSEDRNDIPDSNLTVTTESLPAASAASPLNVQLQATEGTAPYTWQETTGRIPAGITFTKEGKLFGNATGAGGTYNLVFKVTDANGAIRKKALELNTTGNNLDEQIYSWNSSYYFNTQAAPNFIDGTVVTALNGGNSNVTVNGITFQGTNLGGGYKSAYTGGISGTGNTGYNNLLSTMSEATSNEAEIALTGLTVGTTYSLQVFYNNKNDADGFASQMHLDLDGDGPEDVVLKASHTESANTDYGSYVVANFIAYAPEVTLSLKARSDNYSIKGKAAFTALLLTQPATVTSHTGDTKHAEISWEAPVSVTGVQDFVEGEAVVGLNGGDSDISLAIAGSSVVFEATSIGTTSNIANDVTDAIGNPLFSQLMSEQTRTRYYHPLVLENLEVGKTYKVQIFNTAKAFETYQQDYNGTDPTKRHYLGSDTSFGLPKHGDVNVHEFGEVMSSVGTFTATSTEQLIEMNVNEHNSIKDISFSAVYLVEAPDPIDFVMDDGTNRAPTLAEENGSNVTVLNMTTDINSTITTFVGSDPDSGDVQIYSISGGNEDNSFQINSATGELYYINELTGLTSGEFTLEITVSDNKIPAKSATLEHAFQIELTDDTDNDGFADNYESTHGTSIYDSASQPLLVGYWDFNDSSDPLSVTGHEGSFSDGAVLSGASYTADQGGFSGQVGDRAMDFGTTSASQRVAITDLEYVNAATADNVVSFSFWQKNYQVALNSILSATSPTSYETDNFHIESPNRINYYMSWKFERYTKTTWVIIDDEDFTLNWNHYVYIKNRGSIEIWVNGVMLKADADHNFDVASDLIELTLGARQNGTRSVQGMIDDFAIFNEALTESQIQALASGGSPLDFVNYPVPVIADEQNVSTSAQGEGITLSGYSVNDLPLTYTITAAPQYGTLTGTAPNLSYSSNLTGIVQDSFTYTVSDGLNVSAEAIVYITHQTSNEAQPIAHWSMDENFSSVVSDVTGNGHDATLSGATWDSAGTLGSALAFQTGSGGMTLPASAFSSLNQEVTISMWVNGADNQPVANTNFRALVDGDRVLNIHLPWANSAVYWDAGNTGSVFDRTAKGADASTYTGDWNHWVFTKNATTGEMKIYVNGELFQTAIGKTRDMTGITSAVLGSSYNGSMDEVMLFDQELSEGDILAIYESQQSALVAHWSMDEGSGSLVSDITGNGHDATLSGATWDAAGTQGAALAFQTGSGGMALPASAFSSLNQEVTISMWVNGADNQPVANTNFRALVDGDRVLNIHLPWANSAVYWDAGNTGSVFDRTAKGADASTYTGGWNHWVFTKNATTGEMKIYVNGELFQTAIGKTRDMTGITSAVLGSSYNGSMDEIMLFNQEISVEEILEIYKSQKWGLIAHWSMDEGLGNTVSDVTGNGHDATLSGATWDAVGARGGALAFQAESGGMTLPASAFSSLNQEVSISMWVNGADNQPIGNTNFRALADAGRTLNIHLPWANGAVFWDAGNTGAAFDRTFKVAAPSTYKGGWNHWIFTKSATTGEMKIYVNGELFHTAIGKTHDMTGITSATLGSRYNGSMDEVMLFDQALSAVEVLDLYDSQADLGVLFAAADFDGESNPNNVNIVRDEGSQVGYITNNSWISFSSFNLGSGASSIAVSVASPSGGSIEMRAGSSAGTLLATIPISNTGSLTTYQPFSTSLNSNASGVLDLYFVFKGGTGYIMDIETFQVD